MLSAHRILTVLACALVLSTITPAQKQETADKLAKKLNELLDQIQRAMKSTIRPAQVAERLRERTPGYRTFRVAGAEKAAGDAAKTTAAKPVPKARLFGDDERKSLPAGTVMLVEGRPVLEKEINDLADYFASYAPGQRKEHLTRAMEELIKVKSVQSAFQPNLAAAEKKIAELHKQATADGADFAAVAKASSDCPSKDVGGSLGEFGRSGMVASFARWAFTLPVGKVSPVFTTEFGYHILKVTGKQKADAPAQAIAKASHILVMYGKDENKLRNLSMRASSGQSKVAVVSEEWRGNLPATYR